MKKDKPKRPRMTRLTKELIVLGIIGIVLILAYDLSGWGGNIRFYSKWVECGQKPVQPRVFYMGQVPHYSASSTFSLMRRSTHYFCTPLEAERSGHSANPNYYDFPHLREAGESSPL